MISSYIICYASSNLFPVCNVVINIVDNVKSSVGMENIITGCNIVKNIILFENFISSKTGKTMYRLVTFQTKNLKG